eukprot:4579530-Pleurochrysis_carterae.AAC.1
MRTCGALALRSLVFFVTARAWPTPPARAPHRSHSAGAPSPRARAAFLTHGYWYRMSIVIFRPILDGSRSRYFP